MVLHKISGPYRHYVMKFSLVISLLLIGILYASQFEEKLALVRESLYADFIGNIDMGTEFLQNNGLLEETEAKKASLLSLKTDFVFDGLLQVISGEHTARFIQGRINAIREAQVWAESKPQFDSESDLRHLAVLCASQDCKVLLGQFSAFLQGVETEQLSELLSFAVFASIQNNSPKLLAAVSSAFSIEFDNDTKSQCLEMLKCQNNLELWRDALKADLCEVSEWKGSKRELFDILCEMDDFDKLETFFKANMHVEFAASCNDDLMPILYHDKLVTAMVAYSRQYKFLAKHKVNDVWTWIWTWKPTRETYLFIRQHVPKFGFDYRGLSRELTLKFFEALLRPSEDWFENVQQAMPEFKYDLGGLPASDIIKLYDMGRVAHAYTHAAAELTDECSNLEWIIFEDNEPRYWYPKVNVNVRKVSIRGFLPCASFIKAISEGYPHLETFYFEPCAKDRSGRSADSMFDLLAGMKRIFWAFYVTSAIEKIVARGEPTDLVFEIESGDQTVNSWGSKIIEQASRITCIDRQLTFHFRTGLQVMINLTVTAGYFSSLDLMNSQSIEFFEWNADLEKLLRLKRNFCNAKSLIFNVNSMTETSRKEVLVFLKKIVRKGLKVHVVLKGDASLMSAPDSEYITAE